MRDKGVAKYMKILKELFLNINYEEGKFLKNFRADITEYAMRHPNCDYDELVKEYGPPEEIFCGYLSVQDSDYILECINKKNLRRWVMSGVVTIGICCVLIWGFFYYSLYQQSSEDIIEKETIEIDTVQEEKK